MLGFDECDNVVTDLDDRLTSRCHEGPLRVIAPMTTISCEPERFRAMFEPTWPAPTITTRIGIVPEE